MEKKINVTCPNCGADLTIEKVSVKNNAAARIEALKAAGVDVSNLFAMHGANGGEFIARNDENGLSILKDDDPIFQYIVTAGTVNNGHLFRRWVMAQMFHMLSAKHYGTKRTVGFTEMLHRHGYEYTWKMLCNELFAQYKMFQNGDMENFEARNRWFNNVTAYFMANHYIDALKAEVAKRKVKKCKGVPYITIGGKHIFVADLEKKLYGPLNVLMNKIRTTTNITELYYYVCQFNHNRIPLNWQTPQCPAWVDAFKGVGAYYTLQNMIRFHGCFLWNDNGRKLSKDGSLDFLDAKAEEYKSEGWRLLGVMKKALEDNHIDIEAKIASWRKK